MCNEPRVYTTSFRYNGLVSNVINDCPGKSFADKVEYICLDYQQNKERRDKQIKDLDKQIADKKKQLNVLCDKIWKAKNVSCDLEDLVNSLRECNTK